MMKSILLSGHYWGYIVILSALWIEECGGNISKRYECNFSRTHPQNSGMLRRRYCSEKSRQGRPHSRSEDSFEIMRAHQLKMNPTKSFLEVASGKFLGFVVTSKGIHLDPEKFTLSRRCNLQGTSGSSGDCKDDWYTSEGLSQISLEDANPLPSWWKRVSHSSGMMLANKHSRKSNDTSCNHRSLQLRCLENLSW